MKRKLSILLSLLMLAVMLPAGTALAADDPEVKVGAATFVDGTNSVPGATGSAELSLNTTDKTLTLTNFTTSENLEVDLKGNDFTIIVKGNCSFGRIAIDNIISGGNAQRETLAITGDAGSTLHCSSTIVDSSPAASAAFYTTPKMKFDTITLSTQSSGNNNFFCANSLEVNSGTITAEPLPGANTDCPGIRAAGQVTVKGGVVSGKGSDASLNAGHGIYIHERSLTVEGGHVTGIGGNGGSTGGTGVFATGSICVNGGAVTGRSGAFGAGYEPGSGIRADGKLEVKDGTVSGTGGWGMRAGDIYLQGGTISAEVKDKPAASFAEVVAPIYADRKLEITGGNITLASDNVGLYATTRLAIGPAGNPIRFTTPDGMIAAVQVGALDLEINGSFQVNGVTDNYSVLDGWVLVFGKVDTGNENTGNENINDEDKGDKTPGENEAGGWSQNEDGTYSYIDTDGSKATDWAQLDNQWYYFSPAGIMRTGYYQVGRVWHESDKSGAWVGRRKNTGWQKFSKGWSFKANGKWVYGWKEINGERYFFDSSGYMKTGWHKSGGTWYYFKPSGAMAKGWAKAGKWYYMDKKSGAMCTGWIQDGNVDYHLGASGAMSANKWVKAGGKWYWLKASGARAANEWVKNGSKYYWVDKSGAMVTGDTTIDGTVNTFSKSGVWTGVK